VNANPGLEGITLATGHDIAGAIIRQAVKRVKRRKILPGFSPGLPRL